MTRRSRLRLSVVAAALVCGATAGLFLASPSTPAPQVAPPAVNEFGALLTPNSLDYDWRISELASMLSDPKGADLTHARILLNGLGHYGSRVIAVPSRGGRTICYGLAGESRRDPAASYCYQPRSPTLPAEIAGDHFNAMVLYSALEGVPRVQLFGVAFDDVTVIRVQVGGAWVTVPVRNNAFYLDLPTATLGMVGPLEATLADGTRQVHDLRNDG